MSRSRSNFEQFEQVVRDILHDLRDQLGYAKVEPKQKVLGVDGNKDEIDAIAYTQTGEMILIECRQRGRKADKGQVGAFWYKIQNTGAADGLIVNCLGYQKGAEQAANYHQRLRIAVAGHAANANVRLP